MELPIFGCYEGCGECCPDGTKEGATADLALPDIIGLYRLSRSNGGATPEEFVRRVIDFRVSDDGMYFGSWLPVLNSPCPYLTDIKCDAYEDRPYVCRTFPEVLLSTDPPGVSSIPISCYQGTRLTGSRKREINELLSMKRELISDTVKYFGGIIVDPRIMDAFDYLAEGVVPQDNPQEIHRISELLANIGEFEERTAGAIVEVRVRLDERVFALLEGIDGE
ncbi:MAG: YkgJ family cysteine cluster protein [Candidatus Woesearchaeota archaeon]|jgi:Fe-S-cluster containining protein|nr:YkgJ family cysteine cluster protein [Candidatus Woesearchaeota archaeon]MDP7458059.1 YkgJ family cysteine cluster protein [Candidatus Woesearchaeota archaeon]